MATLVVSPAKKPLIGSVPIPADAAMVERWALLASLARGSSRIVWAGSPSSLGDLLQQLGVATRTGLLEEKSRKDLRYLEIDGRGLWGLNGNTTSLSAQSLYQPQGILGVLAAQRFSSALSLPAIEAPLQTLIELLNGRGARLEAKAIEERFDVAIQALNPNQRLDGLERALPLAAEGLKTGLFFSGLFALGPTTLHETWVSPDHCERLLNAVGLPLAAMGPTVSLHPPAASDAIAPFEAEARGDASLATAICLAAQMIPGSQVTVRDVHLNRTRSGVLDFLRQLGTRIGDEVHGEVLGEPYGQTTIVSDVLRGGVLDLEFSSRSAAELPLVCAALSRSSGRSVVVEFAKICARAPEFIELLRAFGIIAAMRGDALELEGNRATPLQAARVLSNGDPWRVILGTLLGLASSGETVIEDADCVALRFPRFVGTLRSLGAAIEVRA